MSDKHSQDISKSKVRYRAQIQAQYRTNVAIFSQNPINHQQRLAVARPLSGSAKARCRNINGKSALQHALRQTKYALETY